MDGLISVGNYLTQPRTILRGLLLYLWKAKSKSTRILLKMIPRAGSAVVLCHMKHCPEAR